MPRAIRLLLEATSTFRLFPDEPPRLPTGETLVEALGSLRPKSVEEALASDWQRVGEALWSAMNKVRDQHPELSFESKSR